MDKPVPKACYEGDPKGLSLRMYAADVYLGDCGSSWTICISEERDMSFPSAIVQTARIPLAFRRFLSTYVLQLLSVRSN